MTTYAELKLRVEALADVLDNLSESDRRFANSLIDNYQTRGLSEKQIYWVGKLLERAGKTLATSESSQDRTEEIFNGHAIRNLLLHASEKLKYPKLRYQTNNGSKLIFNLASSDSKYAGCVFVDNGARAEGKKRYGFISKYGNGTLDRTAPTDIKTLIRKIAENPSIEATLQGQKTSTCCFCGLGLVNKSSVHHGYGPICAGNWGLPWGDTGDTEDEEAAAEAELKHIKLEELPE